MLIQHLYCDDIKSLRDAILNLEFEDMAECPEYRAFEIKLKYLQSRKYPTLLIFDNYNTNFTQNDRDICDKILDYRNVRVIITSRYEVISDKSKIIDIIPLEKESLLKLYAYYRFKNHEDHGGFINERKDLLSEMFKKVREHTFMVELLAKLPMKTGFNEAEINGFLDNYLDHISIKVGATKDNREVEATIKDIMKIIFDMSGLSDAEKNLMTHLALVPLCGIDLSVLGHLLPHDRRDLLNLRDGGWVTMDEESYKIRLHSIIAETIFDVDELKPTNEKCSVFLQNLENEIKSFNENSVEWHDLNRVRVRVVMKIYLPNIKSFFPIMREEYLNPLKDLFELNEYLTEYEKTEGIPDNTDRIRLSDFLTNEEDE